MKHFLFRIGHLRLADALDFFSLGSVSEAQETTITDKVQEMKEARLKLGALPGLSPAIVDGR